MHKRTPDSRARVHARTQTLTHTHTHTCCLGTTSELPKLWRHNDDLAVAVAAESEPLPSRLVELVGRGCAGPAVDLDGSGLTEEQRLACGAGLCEQQIRMLRAQVIKQILHQ